MLAATVLDLDETLADSATTWQRIFRTVAARHGHTWTDEDWTTIQGTSTHNWSTYLAHRCRNLTPNEAATECVADMVTAVHEGAFALLPGAMDLVTTAAERGPVAVVSASPHRYVHAAVTTLGLAPHLNTTITGDDVVHGKPAPDPYLLAAQRLGVTPGRCVAVEDSASGIRSAHAAGMTLLAIPNPTTALDTETLRLADHQAPDAHIATKTLTTLLTPQRGCP